MPVRVYQPEARPVVVYLHGGGFVVCDLETRDSLYAASPATGACVVAVDYRRAPEHPWPAAVDDAVVVLTALASGDTPVAERGDPLAVAGDSAGGMLAVLAALRQPRIPLVAGRLARRRRRAGPALAGIRCGTQLPDHAWHVAGGRDGRGPLPRRSGRTAAGTSFRHRHG